MKTTTGQTRTLPVPLRTLQVRGSIFGNTLARVFDAVDQLPLGAVLAVHTNDP